MRKATLEQRKVTFPFRIDPELLDRVKTVARRDDRTPSAIVRVALRRYLAERERETAEVT